jgi:radical SAM protein
MPADHVYRVAPRNVYWETTIACDLDCRHCRASAITTRDPRELSGEEARELIRDVANMGSMLVLTGGDPLKRPDIYELIAFARALDVPVSITPSITPTLTESTIRRLAELGVSAMAVSLDGPNPEIHDEVRRVPGTYALTLRALGWARAAGIPVQVNTTITRFTAPGLASLYELLASTATPPVRRWSLFLLVPVGRGAELQGLGPDEVEELFAWIHSLAKRAPFHVSTVEAPHYRRFVLEREREAGRSPAELEALGRRMGFGIRDGNGVVFVSHLGEVAPAGFLPITVGNVREQPLSVIYRESPLLLELRDTDRLQGKCGRCEFRAICGGSRARAFAATGDPMASDPACPRIPEG